MDFPISEYEERHSRARGLMAEKDIDVLLVNNVSNYVYLTGHRAGIWEWRTPHVLILPREHEPILIGPQYMEPSLRGDSCIKDVRIYMDNEHVSSLVRKALEEKGLTNGNMGVEMGMRQRLAMPYNDFRMILNELPGIKAVDASKLFWDLRVVKSKAEIACLRKTCWITSQAYERLFDILEKGITEREIRRRMYIYMLENGADKPLYSHAHIWPGGVYLSEPTDRALKTGDVLWMDAGSVYKGYGCDFGRMGVVGSPNRKIKETYEYVRDITQKCIEVIRPGIKVSEIYDTFAQHARPDLRPGHPGLIGHGIGLDLIEPEFIGVNNNAIVRTGMMLAIEPGALTEYGHFKTEQNLIVTENGCEVLSTASLELHVI